jgi:hypothetical protein
MAVFTQSYDWLRMVAALQNGIPDSPIHQFLPKSADGKEVHR